MSENENAEAPAPAAPAPEFDLETPDIPLPEILEKAEIKDQFETAFKFAIIGSGQGGSRLAESFYTLGYRRVCAINSTEQDLANIKLPAENKFCIGSGGAGKNPAVAAALFAERREDVLDFMSRSFGPVFNRIFVCIGAGGGTGAGTVSGLVQTAHDLQIAVKCPDNKVGVIVALPKNSEGKKVNENAYNTLSELIAHVKNGVVSPLIILDNERISQIFPGLAVDPFWATANNSVVSLLNLFNTVSTKNSTYTTFDPNDFKMLLDSGVIVFGATPVKKWDSATDISLAVRDNLKRNIISGGIDLSTGSVAAAVVIGGKGILSTVPAEYIDHAYDQLTRLLRPGSTVHRGIYSGSKETLVVYTVIGGLESPAAKLDELRKLGDVVINPANGGRSES